LPAAARQSFPIAVDNSRLARGSEAGAHAARAIATETETGAVPVAIPRLLTEADFLLIEMGSGYRIAARFGSQS